MALRLHAIDDFVNDLLNARSHVVDASGGKGGDHEIAQAAMIRWIKVQHPSEGGPVSPASGGKSVTWTVLILPAVELLQAEAEASATGAPADVDSATGCALISSHTCHEIVVNVKFEVRVGGPVGVLAGPAKLPNWFRSTKIDKFC